MNDHDEDDAALLRKQRHFLQQIEMELRRINREIIHRRIPELNRESFMSLALKVAELRTSYLQIALQLGQTASETPQAQALLLSLRESRVAFEEARDAFAALERTIEQGYVDIKA